MTQKEIDEIRVREAIEKIRAPKPIYDATPGLPAVPTAKNWYDHWAFLLLIVVALIVWVAVATNHPSAPESTQGDPSENAFYAAQSFVEKRLKAPTTAKFCDYSEATVRADGDTFVVSGWLDAKNEFGVPLRLHFSCSLLHEPAAHQWRNLSCSVSE